MLRLFTIFGELLLGHPKKRGSAELISSAFVAAKNLGTPGGGLIRLSQFYLGGEGAKQLRCQCLGNNGWYVWDDLGQFGALQTIIHPLFMKSRRCFLCGTVFCIKT